MQRFNAFLLSICLFSIGCGGAQKAMLAPDSDAITQQRIAEQERNAQLKKQQKEEKERRAWIQKLLNGDQIVKKDMNICHKLPGQPGTKYLFEKTGNICTIKPDDQRSLSVHMSHFYRILEKLEDKRDRSFLEQAMRQAPMAREDGLQRSFGRHGKIIDPNEIR